MDIPVVGTGYRIYLDPFFQTQLDAVLEKNTYQNLTMYALFISRLIKGLQDLTNSDIHITRNWGNCLYSIDDIGIVKFRPVMDADTGAQALIIESINWTFATSKFFSEFNE